MDPTEVSTVRDAINSRFCQAVNFLLASKRARNKSEIMNSLGLYLGRLSLILGGSANVSTDNLAVLSKVYGVSTEFLLLGSGPIVPDDPSSMSASAYRASLHDNSTSAATLPLIPIAAIAGFNGVDEPGVRLEDCAHYAVPEFSAAGADFLIRVMGSSMTPTFVSGDLVACKRLSPDAWIEYGDPYVIDGLLGVMIKRVFNHPDDPELLLCKSDNPDVAPFSVRKSEVRSLSKVIGVIRNS